MTIFHPNSGIEPCVQSFAKAGQERAVAFSFILNEEPWLPFVSCADFKFAALAIQSRLTAELIDDWLAFNQQTADESKHLGFRSHKDLYEALDMVSSLLTPVCTD